MSTATHSIYPDLPGFAKENRELVYAMCEAGWTGRITSKGHWMAKAPDGTTQITVPAKNGNNRGLKNAHATFMRWLKASVPDEEKRVWDAAKDTEDPIIQDIIAESLVKKQTVRLVQEQNEREYAQAVANVRQAIEEGVIVIEPLIRPWLAKKQPGKDGGQRYESQTTLERVWPDGYVDYICAVDGCGYTNEKPRSVAMHYGAAHTRKGEAPAAEVGPLHADPGYTEPEGTRVYRPTERLLNTLAEFLAEHSWDNVDDLALLFLTWANDRPDLEHTERPLVPLTERQILDKIRLLVGQPDQSREIETLRNEIAVLESEVTRLREERAALRELLA